MVRFSNGEQTLSKDSKGQPRGIAIQLIGVDGPKLLTIPGETDADTQDFLATSHSVSAGVRDLAQFRAVVEASECGKIGFLPALVKRLSPLNAWKEGCRIFYFVIRNIVISKVRSVASEHHPSIAPIKMGPYAVKFAILPSAEVENTSDIRRQENYLRVEPANRLRKGDIRLDFMVRFFADDGLTPIEDTSVEWETSVSPMIKVAELLITRKDIDDPAAMELSLKIDNLSFSSRHSIENHRPLGQIMRARKLAYQASSKLRGHSFEPSSLPL